MVPCAILTASQTLVPKLIGILTLQCARYCRPALARSALAARHTRAGGATQAFPGKCYDNTFYMKRLPQCIFGPGNDSSQGGVSSHECSPAPVSQVQFLYCHNAKNTGGLQGEKAGAPTVAMESGSR